MAFGSDSPWKESVSPAWHLRARKKAQCEIHKAAAQQKESNAFPRKRQLPPIQVLFFLIKNQGIQIKGSSYKNNIFFYLRGLSSKVVSFLTGTMVVQCLLHLVLMSISARRLANLLI